MNSSSYLQASRVMVLGAKSPVDRRRRSLERVNKELSRGNYETALSLVKQLKSKHGCLSAFGSAKLLPKKLDMSSKSDLWSLIDSVSRNIESVYVQEDSVRISKEEETKTSPEEDWFAVVQHESGHFLVGYLLGVLPRYYEIPTLEAIRQNVSSVTGRVEFVGFEFLKQVGAANQLMKDDRDSRMNLSDTQGNLFQETLNNFSCVILGGMVTEHILFGYSEGFYSDVVKLNDVLRWLGFTETEKEAHIRWAVSNTVSLLHSHSEARVSLAEAMAKAKPIGACIAAIESAISRHQI
ncbi:Peptidase M41-like [Arabidopsis thaliana x Arabidopsis arenosa]|uniref:Peptidase M41-like n=1 Tax=Arabidopsis thaliana x Arabidopsis arenosa TaxID=1240361 RepID=A0A8T2BE85_9BRAS|nr:Peptidase M41-like [Arabidopsis thaliana x Arabidopsis arenosa]